MIASKPVHLALGQIRLTRGAAAALAQSGESAASFLLRHARGDWGEISVLDAVENERALEHGLRVMSVYRTRADERIWIITEADRSSTCLLLPEEY